MRQILSSFGRRGVRLNLDTLKADINDTTYLSKYFVVAEFNPVFTAGRNPVSFNGSELLAPGSEIKVECLDSEGNPLYIEYPKSNIQYQDVAKFLISINVFDEAYNGPGKLIFIGTTAKNEIVKWTANISIDKTLQNASKVRFLSKPTLEVRGLLYPVVTNDSATTLTKIVPYTGSFYSVAITPLRDTNRLKIDPKKTDVDYRIVLNSATPGPVLYPTTSFNTQMEGQTISMLANRVQMPYSYKDTPSNPPLTSSVKIKKVLDDHTLQIEDAIFFPYGKDQVVTVVSDGVFTSSYTYVTYNTASDAYLKYTVSGMDVYIQQSYAEVLYRNLRPFSGFIARHKLYRRSLIYPGDFQLIADEPLGAMELLTDPVTTNQTYPDLGRFYNQWHINKYWFTTGSWNNLYDSGSTIQPKHSVSPYIDGIRLGNAAPSYSDVDGRSYLIAKADSPLTTNDAAYVPYSSASFLYLSGSSYNSNFIPLKGGALYVLSMNVQLEKDENSTDARVEFYFTSSVPEIKFEKDYISPYGYKLGEIATNEQINVKRFNDKQYLFFTPANDYYGTLVIVPYRCVPTFSEMSLKVYGDYGFSPDILFSKIPFKVNVKNETFQFKAELFDINSTLVYSDLQTLQTFDPDGKSLYTYFGGSNLDPALATFISGSLTISQSLFLPNIRNCPQSGIRFVGWHTPIESPPSHADGELCFTDVSNLSGSDSHIFMTQTNVIGDTFPAQSVNVRFSSTAGGRRIFVDTGGTHHDEP